MYGAFDCGGGGGGLGGGGGGGGGHNNPTSFLQAPSFIGDIFGI